MIEVLIAVAVLAIVAAIGLQAATSLTRTSKESKLESDTQSLNRAVTMYLASGGDLSSTTTASGVLAKLKTTSSAAQAKTQINPLTSSMVDSRLTIELQTTAEAASSKPRAYWNSGTQQFDVATSGAAGGIRAFVMDEAAAPALPQVETRNSGAMEFASQSGWIWDYKNNWAASVAPTTVPTAVPLASVSPPATVLPTPSPPPPSPPPTPLAPPSFSIPPGNYPITDFDLAVVITDPNSVGPSALEYSVDSGAWTSYSSAVNISPGSNLRARALSVSAVFADSSVPGGNFDADPVTLLAPELTLSATAFDPGLVDTVTVSLNNLNDSAVSRIDYRIDGGVWATYSAPFPLTMVSHPIGASIDARTVSTAPYYTDSPSVSAAVAGPPSVPTFPTNAVLSQDSSTRLYSVQVNPALSTASYSNIAPAGAVQYNAIGYRSGDGMLYGINPSTGQLVMVDPSNGSATVSASLGLVSAYAGDFNTDDGLYYIKLQSQSRLYAIDVDAGTVVKQVNITPSLGAIGDLAYNSADGKFYSYDESGKRFYAIDPNTGAATGLPSHSANPSGHAGAAFASNGNVFIAVNSGGLYWLDMSDGTVQWIASSPSSSLNDGAILGP